MEDVGAAGGKRSMTVMSFATARERDLGRWVEAGLIDAATAQRILAFESTSMPGSRTRPGVPSLTELLIYLAAAIVAAGTAVLAGTNWDHLSTPARIAIPGVSSVAVFGAGYLSRRIGNEAAMRGASLLWLLAGALAVGTVAIAAVEADWSENNVALISALTAVVASILLWYPMRMHPQVAGMAGAAFLLATALSVRARGDWDLALFGGTLAAVGIAALVATERGILTPVSSGRIFAGAALAVGALYAGLPPSPPIAELLALVVMVGLIVAGVRYQSLVYVAFGVLTAFMGLLRLILRHVDSPTVAGVALIIIGLLLLVSIAALQKTRPWEARPTLAG
jgi:hypothetical protein